MIPHNYLQSCSSPLLGHLLQDLNKQSIWNLTLTHLSSSYNELLSTGLIVNFLIKEKKRLKIFTQHTQIWAK